MLSNRAKPLRHGYFMLKNRSQKQLADKALTPREARQAELEWFGQSEFARQGQRLGVQVLQQALSELLVSRIEEGLPSMFEEAKAVLIKSEAQLTALGEAPPTEAYRCRSESLSAAREVVRVLRRSTEFVDAAPEKSAAPCVVSLENRARKRFREAVQKTRPNFDGEKDKTASFRGDLVTRIEEGRGRELPGFMSFHVFTLLVSDFVTLWKAPTECFHKTLHDALTAAAELAIDSHAGLPPLAKRLKSELSAHLEASCSEAQERLGRLLEQEMRPCTENHYLWDTINKLRNERLESKIDGLATKVGEPEFVRKVDVIAMLKSDVGNDSNESQEVQDMIDIRILEVGCQALH